MGKRNAIDWMTGPLFLVFFWTKFLVIDVLIFSDLIMIAVMYDMCKSTIS